MGRAARRRGVAGIVATVIMFAILFTVGTSYFIFVNASNSQYVQNLVSASNKLQGSLGERLLITTLLANNGDVAFYVNNTSGLNSNMTAVYVLAASGGMLRCDGVGLPSSAGCSNTSPALWAEVNAGKGSPATGIYDTGYVYVSGMTDTVKLLTQRGNMFSATYPNSAVNQAVQAQTSQALQINLSTYKWVQLLPQATSLVQKAYTGNCNSANCAKAFGSSVSAADTLVYALGWYNANPPTTPTDTLSDSFTLAASQSVTSNVINPVMVQDAYSSNCNSNSCGKQFGSSVTQGNILAYGLGWYTNSPPSTPTDTLGDTFSLAASQSVVGTGSPSLVQKAFTPTCNSNNCGKQFTSSVTAHNVLAVAIGWNNAAPPSTPTDTLGNTYTLTASTSLPGTPTQYTSTHMKFCDTTNSCAPDKLNNAKAGDIVVLTLGWYSHADPTSVTDTFSDSFTQAIEKTVTVSGTTYYSAIYYAICSTCNNDDTISANFASNVNSISASAYEISGATTTGLQTSTGSATSGATTASVTSFTPASNSYAIAGVETSGAANFGDSPPWNIPGGPGPCNGGDANGCSQSASNPGATTAPMTLTNSLGFAETAISFPPASNGYNSYIWDTTTAASGTDTITAAFSSTVQGSVSVYELNEVTTSGAQTSTGSSTSGPNTSTVTSFTPASNSFVIGNTEVGAANPGFGQGAGFTIIQGGGGGCNAGQGCSEYEAGLGSATTVSMNLGMGENTWVEAAISFPPSSITLYSYLWYATAASSGTDTISASFGATVVGSVSIYEISGATISGLLTSTGSSSGGSTTSSVTSFNVNSNSIVIGNTETDGGTTFTAGSGQTLVATCNNVYGCSQYVTGASGSRTSPMTLNPSAPWVEVAMALSPATWTFYSYIWTATAATTGSDTITAAFSGSVVGSVSVYDLSGYNPAAILSSTGSSSSSSTSVSVPSFTPTLTSVVIGNTEAAAAPNYAAGAGFTLVATCNGVYGCSESQTGVSTATTAPMTLNNAEPWVEAAVSIGAQINAQSGFLVGGYPAMGVQDQNNIAWHANFTNTDPGHRAVTLWPQSEISITGVQSGGPKHYDYFIIANVNQGVTGLVAYPANPASFITVPYGSTVQLWFAANAPLTASYAAIDFDNSLPYQALFSLTGVFSDGTLYGETIPYPTGIITEADAQESVSAGNAGTQVTVTCQACGYKLSVNAMIGWIDHSGKTTVLTTFTTTNNGGIPANTKFTVPSGVPAGYYTIMVSDYVNTEFMTFQKTGSG